MSTALSTALSAALSTALSTALSAALSTALSAALSAALSTGSIRTPSHRNLNTKARNEQTKQKGFHIFHGVNSNCLKISDNDYKLLEAFKVNKIQPVSELRIEINK